MRQINLISRITIALIFLYHGWVPKLIFANSQEIMMNKMLLPMFSERAALLISGYAEIAYAILLIVFIKSKWIVYPAMAFSLLATVVLVIVLPELFQNAFNPFSINFAVFILCLINLNSFSPDQTLSRTRVRLE